MGYIDWQRIQTADVERISSDEDAAEEYFNLLLNVFISFQFFNDFCTNFLIMYQRTTIGRLGIGRSVDLLVFPNKMCSINLVFR